MRERERDYFFCCKGSSDQVDDTMEVMQAREVMILWREREREREKGGCSIMESYSVF